MSTQKSFVEIVRPLLEQRPPGEQLYMVALLESGAGQRYRQWAAAERDDEVAAGLTVCAEREDAIAATVRDHFAAILAQPADFGQLVAAIQREVEVLFGGKSFEEQAAAQAAAERGGEQFWTDLAAGEKDTMTKAILLDCAGLEAASAEFLENLIARR